MYISVAAIIDKTVELRFYNQIGTAVARSYEDDNAVRIMEGIIAQFNKDVRPSLQDAKRVLVNNHEYLNRIESDVVVSAAVKRDERLQWYWKGRNLFDVVFGRVVNNPESNIQTPIVLTNKTQTTQTVVTRSITSS